MSGRLVGVGVGPGDPGLVTVRALEVLEAADSVLVPVAEGAPGPGYAERVVRAHLPHAVPLTRVTFSLDPDPARREASWERAAATVARAVGGGATAAFATLGDPALYSTFTRLARAVRRRLPGLRVETVPGITAMQDLAARTGTVLTEGREALTLLPFTAGADRLRAALAGSDTLVLYKGGRHLPAVGQVLREAGCADRAVYGARLGLEAQDVRRALPGEPAPYLSTVLVPPDREGRRGPEASADAQGQQGSAASGSAGSGAGPGSAPSGQARPGSPGEGGPP